MGDWMIYGANGYTGRLIVAEAVRRGMTPVLAGRNALQLGELAQRYGLPVRAFDLSNRATAASALSGVPLVLNCAGPFSATVAPMLEACLAAGAHYLDITGEIDVFAHCHAQHERAAERGIVVVPGTGFDVVPTDCTAAMLAQRLPDADSLVLAFEAGGGLSPGTAKTSVEGMAKGGRIRRNGALIEVPLAYRERQFVRDGEALTAVTIPWGDVFTAFVSTGVPNVEVYTIVPPAAVVRLKRMRKINWLLRFPPLRRFVQSRIERRVPGPSEAKRARTGFHVWGEIRRGGELRTLELAGPNGYDLTVTAALGIVTDVLATPRNGGYYTPSQLMGAEYALSLPGVRKVAES
ncbi:MAG TPA: saccharopine dehydrogenase NADP-binding domain-containing protein [Xanthomonadales bacterium]|nr:saccharopine dehydrogenase NADP-binding domain-containing protein [Xanthomonadales bacterium]